MSPAIHPPRFFYLVNKFGLFCFYSFEEKQIWGNLAGMCQSQFLSIWFLGRVCFHSFKKSYSCKIY